MSSFVKARSENTRKRIVVPVTKPKRFLIFGGRVQDSCGGWNDLVGSADRLEDARNAAEDSLCEWTQIVDLETGREVPFRD